eukprot:CAMPEP_0171571872 /NCGR_PEP_ID=MMETSP0961-20121227/3763_1 /TAXON_ID=87120 /ORGANISM="Aurantiochytrium limacinum, Strain ATCCMYA-1381" /LENGTH=220 /DNA_ID=CAMNT_0012126565 /DNA_START=1163 /DNA_END=1826 /DNA_ORIENTATION=-
MALFGGSTMAALRSAARLQTKLSVRGLSTKTELSPGAKVGVVGLGLMGHGIAQLAADKAGFQVVALDTNPQAMEKGLKAIENSLGKVYAKKLKDADSSEVEKKVKSVMSQIHGTSDVNDLKGCEIVVEAIIENLEIKKKFYKQLGEVCDKDTILASNTSSFPIGHLADASGRPDKVVGVSYPAFCNTTMPFSFSLAKTLAAATYDYDDIGIQADASGFVP